MYIDFIECSFSSTTTVEGVLCPIVGCDQMIRHYVTNKSRHIKENHGMQLADGSWVLARYQCTECAKVNKTKDAKRKENLGNHFKTAHPEKKLDALIVHIPIQPLQYKTEVNSTLEITFVDVHQESTSNDQANIATNTLDDQFEIVQNRSNDANRLVFGV